MALLNFRRKPAEAPAGPNPPLEAFLKNYSIEVMPRRPLPTMTCAGMSRQ